MGVFKWNVPFFRPKFGDCTHHLNCHLRRFKPSFVPFRKANIPGQFYIGDIDGVLALEDGNTLFLEFKTEGVKVAEPQMMAYSVLSAKEGQDALIVWHKAGAVDAAVSYQFITEGKKRAPERLANGHQGLMDVLRAWAYLQEPQKDVRAISAELDRIKLERENLIYHVLFCLDEISARQEGRSLDIRWINNSAREARSIDWRFFELSRISDFRKAQNALRKAQKRISRLQWVTGVLVAIIFMILIIELFNLT